MQVLEITIDHHGIRAVSGHHGSPTCLGIIEDLRLLKVPPSPLQLQSRLLNLVRWIYPPPNRCPFLPHRRSQGNSIKHRSLFLTRKYIETERLVRILNFFVSQPSDNQHSPSTYYTSAVCPESSSTWNML